MPFGCRRSLLDPSCPARAFRRPYGWPTRLGRGSAEGSTRAVTGTLSGFPRSASVRCDRGGLSLYSGVVVSLWAPEVPIFFRATKSWRGTCDPGVQPPPAVNVATFPAVCLTKPHREFARASPSGLPLACEHLMAGASWASPSCVHRLVAKADGEGGDKCWILTWKRPFCFRFTHLVRLRVAQDHHPW